MNKYSKLILSYGFITMLYIKQVLLEKEMYEELQEMENGFIYLEKELRLSEYPRELNETVFKDLEAEFFKLNLNGQNAVKNYIHYIPECLRILGLDNLQDEFLHLYF